MRSGTCEPMRFRRDPLSWRCHGMRSLGAVGCSKLCIWDEHESLGVRGWTALVDTLALALWDSKSSTQPSLLDFWPTELRDVKKWTLGGRWKRGSRGRVHMHAYGWFTLMYGRNPRHTTVFSTNAMQNYHIPININELKEKVDVVLSQEMCNKPSW